MSLMDSLRELAIDSLPPPPVTFVCTVVSTDDPVSPDTNVVGDEDGDLALNHPSSSLAGTTEDVPPAQEPQEPQEPAEPVQDLPWYHPAPEPQKQPARVIQAEDGTFKPVGYWRDQEDEYA